MNMHIESWIYDKAKKIYIIMDDTYFSVYCFYRMRFTIWRKRGIYY